ncbi:MAG: UDPGP type 1 family protein [Gemmataceae bacterium]|nr:UDPGP type 1 family protein [Gemmataceae bacterium]
MRDLPEDLHERLRRWGQLHLLHGWERLSGVERAGLIRQLTELPWEELVSLATRTSTSKKAWDYETLEPPPVSPAATTAEERTVGQATLAQGRVALLVVAGGQGTRLGRDEPKGLFPIGPLSGASLFQIHAEKVLALSRRYQRPLLWLIMTSPATDAATRAFFEQHGYFGLKQDQIRFFQQATVPVLCAQSHRLLLESPGRLLLSPNGHGGTLTALAEHGLLDELESRGIHHIFYFQVDNPLVRIGDAGFLGRHVLHQADVSSKVVWKHHPQEKVGVFAVQQGRCILVEYSDLPLEVAQQQTSTGRLRFAAGNPAIHIFRRDFLQRLITHGQLPYHLAHKVAPYYDPILNQQVVPASPNALKFERFIFDALPHARRWLLVETPREEEFAPLKNAEGPDSPTTVRQAILALHRRWVESCGVQVEGNPAVEISPLLAMDAEELAQRLPSGYRLSGPLYLRPPLSGIRLR